MAIVYRAFDRRLSIERAIKRINPDLNKHERARARFISEARALARLSHPGIVQVFDVVVEPEDAYIVMELVEGGNLARWLADNGPMPAGQAVPIIAAVLEALQAAHDAGVVHRDIKPHNILLSSGASTTVGKVRLTDFGIARMDEDDHNLTRTGVTMGTWAWMAPEQRADAKNVDARADIYGVGATFYSLLTGLTPRDLFAVDQDPSLFEGIPANLVGLIRRATRYRREDRYPDAEAFLRDLQRADANASRTIVPFPESPAPEKAAATFGEDIAPEPLIAARSPLVALSPAAEIGDGAIAPSPLRQRPARPVNLTQRTVHAMSQWRPAQWIAAGAVLLVMCGLTGWAIAGWLGFPLEDDPAQTAGLSGPLRLDPVVSPEDPSEGLDEEGFAPPPRTVSLGGGTILPEGEAARPEPLDLTTDREPIAPGGRLKHPLDPPASEQRALVAPREVEDPIAEPPPAPEPAAPDPAPNPLDPAMDDPPVVPVIGGSGDPPDPGLVEPQPEEPSPDEDLVPRIGQPVDSGTPSVTPPPTPEDPTADPVPSGEVSSPTTPPNPEDGTEL